jgi:magnesium-transporting ATPase (P-type)
MSGEEKVRRPRRRSTLIDQTKAKMLKKLPPSLPKKWPRSTEEEILEKPTRQIYVGNDQQFLFRNNFVKTSKYEWYNFLPKFLLEEFNPRTKIANCYFLFISCLQCIPIISNTGGLPTTLLPLTIVVTINAILQINEDMSRHKADKEANASLTHIYVGENNEFQPLRWADLAVGDVVKVDSRSQLPADVLVLAVAGKEGEANKGICYVETKSLDGETNLKIRMAMPSTATKVTEDTMGDVRGFIEMEHPNKLIDSFTGALTFEGKTEPIQPNNVLLRGCVLRNTNWIIGVVLNTGTS